MNSTRSSRVTSGPRQHPQGSFRKTGPAERPDVGVVLSGFLESGTTERPTSGALRAAQSMYSSTRVAVEACAFVPRRILPPR